MRTNQTTSSANFAVDNPFTLLVHRDIGLHTRTDHEESSQQFSERSRKYVLNSGNFNAKYTSDGYGYQQPKRQNLVCTYGPVFRP